MGISRRILQMTNGAFDVKAGSLFPALHHMEQAGVAHFELGSGGNKSACKVLFIDKGRQKAASDRNSMMGTDIPRDGNGTRNQLGGLSDHSISCALEEPVSQKSTAQRSG